MNTVPILNKLENNITCVAVSKTFPASVIRDKFGSGFLHFGENKVQEFEKKWFELSDLGIVWHFIGHLQSNKLKKILGKVQYLHSMDSLSLYEKISKQANSENGGIKVLLQVNISKEEKKSGFDTKELIQILPNLVKLSHSFCPIMGLMCIGSSIEIAGEQKVRQEFEAMQELFCMLKKSEIEGRFEMRHLSMGMSSDWEIALEYGSNMVRVGSLIFGAREVSCVR